jgi:PKD repeat protein
MKKALILLFAVLLSGFGYAQFYTLNISGYVYQVTNNNMTPVPNQQVLISIDSTNTGFTYQNAVVTNENGYYEDVVTPPYEVSYGWIQTMTYDSCLGTYLYNQQFFAPGDTLISMDFLLCGTAPGCQAMFYYWNDPETPYTFTFQNISTGNFTEVTWSFGDSTYSTEMNPVHTFPGPGVYTVCLTISDGNECNSTYCEPVYVGNGGYGCENYFNWYPTDPSGSTISFEGYLMNGQQAYSYDWDFGDGTIGSGQFVTHTYEIPPNGNSIFMVSLTTTVPDSSGATCTYTSWQEVWLYTQPDCYAYYYYFPDSMDVRTIHFQDMSYTANGGLPTSWYWDFGDSTFSTLQNPVHTYADSGYYFVCLTIADSMGNCTNTYCEEIYTGIIPPPNPCESYIMPYNQYGLTVELQGWTMSQYPTDYTWEFGDGVTGTGEFVTHTYANPGIYMVSLYTIDTTGCSWMSYLELWIDSTYQGCSNYFFYEQTDSTTFTFTGEAYLNNGTTTDDVIYSWDFGDGTYGTGQTITHYFQPNPAGIYSVCLTTYMMMANNDTCVATSCQDVWMVQPSFSIYGHVYLQNNLVADYAYVHLMTMDTLWQNVIEVGTVTLDSSGFYSFPNVPMYNSRVYYIQAELTEGSAHYGEYLPTYHQSALNWESADPVLPLMNWPADIFMIPGTLLNSGNGTITGTVNNLGARGMMEDVEVVLMDGQMNPYYYIRSDEQGNFSFDNLPYGTYILHAEIMGIHTNQATVILTEGQPEVSVEIQVAGGEANVVFGIHEQKSAIEKVGDIYPNPVNSNSMIEISMKEPTMVELSTYNQLGQIVMAKGHQLSAGTHSIRLITSDLKPGLYLLRITTTEGDLVTRRFVKNQ